MGIQNWAKNIILVRLPPEPKMFDDLDGVTKTIRGGRNCDVVIDLAGVDIMTAPGAARLLTLHKLLTKCKRSLVLCSVSRAIKGILTSNGLDGVLQLADGNSPASVCAQLLRNKD